ncbi:P-loop containing nucleoside triphosphate hydrolase protein, partial [Peniophora sp. CONT]
VVMTVGDQATGTYRVRGQVAKAAGKAAAIKTEIKLDGKAISGMTTVGRSQRTTAEQNRAQYVLDILQGKFSPWDNPWLKAINGDLSAWPEEWAAEKSPSAFIEETTYPLNASQLYAIRHMLSPSPDARLTLIQGPPGTGKTSVIATYVSCSIQAKRRGIWLVAQSNVAVKNIAEKLFKINFTAFRLLVSKDFKFDWHDHLYQGLDRNIIESGQFPKTPGGFRDAVGGVQVILCTLSMLSNPRLPGFFKLVPLIHLVIDEASQIEIGNYATIFNNGTALRKVCFIGDDKQLPPHGTEEIEVLESIFEKRHLRDSMCFLDTQYRMPPQIGGFISTSVYNGNLDSNPEHPVTDATIACRFIDVVGASEQKSGTSWVVRACICSLRVFANSCHRTAKKSRPSRTLFAACRPRTNKFASSRRTTRSAMPSKRHSRTTRTA